MTRSFVFVSAFILALSGPAVLAESIRTHTVIAGETLYSIAAAQLGDGARWAEIAAINRIADPSKIRAGAVLRLPARAPGVVADGASPDARAPLSGRSDARVVANVAHDHAPVTVDSETASISQPGPSSLPEFDTRNALVISSLRDALALAEAHHPDLRAAKAELAAARTRLDGARMAGRRSPRIEGELGRRTTDLRDGSPEEQSGDWGVAVTREFEVGGQQGRRLETARIEIERAELIYRHRVTTFRLDLAAAIVEAAAARDRVTLARDDERLRREVARIAAARVVAGDAAGLEESLARVEAMRSSAERARAEQKASAALSGLRAAIGLSTGRLPGDPPIILATSLHGPVRAVLSDLDARVRRRPDLAAGRLGETLALAQSRQALAEGRDNIEVGGGYRREENVTDIVYARVSVPFPLGNRNAGEAKRLLLEAEAARELTSSSTPRALEEANVALNALEGERRRFAEFLDTGLQISNENLDLVAESYREGLVSLAEVLVVQTAALTARHAWLDAVFAWNAAWVNLQRALGTELGVDEVKP